MEFSCLIFNVWCVHSNLRNRTILKQQWIKITPFLDACYFFFRNYVWTYKYWQEWLMWHLIILPLKYGNLSWFLVLKHAYQPRLHTKSRYLYSLHASLKRALTWNILKVSFWDSSFTGSIRHFISGLLNSVL